MESRRYDIAVIGGGIIGMATAMALVINYRLSLILLEAEERLAAHQSGRNSGVIHAGLYYKPGTKKARYCVEGRDALFRFCEERGIIHERCGKIVIATRKEEIPILDELERRGRANGLSGLERLGAEEIVHREPHAAGIEGLFVPETGIVDFTRVTEAFADVVREGGGEIVKGSRVHAIRGEKGGMVLGTSRGDFLCRYLVNCGGLYSDRIARMCGVDPRLLIIPFRGEYYRLVPGRRHLVRNLIYPVPDPGFPFLGVHFTRMIDGEVEAGPNAVLAFKREGYRRTDFSLSDTIETFAYRGFRKMASRFWKMGISEFTRSLSKGAFLRALRVLIPEITEGDLYPGESGVRAQALEPDGHLVDDFRIEGTKRTIHVLNAPSPAATASITIGEAVAKMAVENFGLG